MIQKVRNRHLVAAGLASVALVAARLVVSLLAAEVSAAGDFYYDSAISFFTPSKNTLVGSITSSKSSLQKSNMSL